MVAVEMAESAFLMARPRLMIANATEDRMNCLREKLTLVLGLVVVKSGGSAGWRMRSADEHDGQGQPSQGSQMSDSEGATRSKQGRIAS